MLSFMFHEAPTISRSQDSLEVNFDFCVNAALMICCETEIDFYCPPVEWWAARDLRKWVTTSSSQLINNLVMPASRHQILSAAVANLCEITDGQ